jgi:hypothetical protein
VSNAQFLNRTTNRRTDEYGGEFENRARILFEVVKAVLDEVDPSRVGVKISPVHEGSPMAAHDETLPMAEYAVRELDGYGLSHLLLMGNTTDFTGTPLEPLMGNGMFRHFRPFRGTLIANVNMTAERGNRLIADGLADMSRSAGPTWLIPTWSSGSRPVPRSPKSTGKPSTPRAARLFRLSDDPPRGRLIHPNLKETDMTKTTPEQNKAIVQAFETLFNKRDYAAAERFCSDHYIQHSAHIAPGRAGLFDLIRTLPETLRYENQLIVAEGDYVIAHRRFSGNGRPGLDRRRRHPLRRRQARRALGRPPGRGDASRIRERTADVRRSFPRLIARSLTATKDTTHETLRQHHLHHGRRVGYRPRARRGPAQARQQGRHRGSSAQPSRRGDRGQPRHGSG